MVEMIVTAEFKHRGQPVQPGDVIQAGESESSFLALSNFAEPVTGTPSADISDVDATTWLADYARQIVELEHKYLTVKGFLNAG